MGLLRTAMRAGIAKKVWNEARKPKNQAKAKELFNKVTGKRGTSASRPKGRTPRR